jgi:hypothetical protein
MTSSAKHLHSNPSYRCPRALNTLSIVYLCRLMLHWMYPDSAVSLHTYESRRSVPGSGFITAV